MLEKFYTDAFDNETALINNNAEFKFKDLKALISSAAAEIKNKKQNIAVSESSNFNFIIKFFACIFTGKNIYLAADLKNLSETGIDYDLFSGTEFKPADFKLNKPDENSIIINFLTSGSSSSPKIIRKSLSNLIKEGEDINKAFNFKGLTAASAVSMMHLFGMTFHLMTPLCGGMKIYTPSIFYPESLNIKNALLAAPPSFLSALEKHRTYFDFPPEYIISAGSKLPDNVFKYFEEKSKVIEIYGSTETGVIAHREHHNEPLKLFDNVSVKVFDNYTEITSPYAYGEHAKINDKTELEGRTLTVKNRTDRILKIYDKRINAESIEIELNKSPLVNESFVLLSGPKPSCLCALSIEGQEFLMQEGMQSLKKQLKNYAARCCEITPQRWKFIDELPRTQAGKINKDLIEHIFSVNLSFPVILNRAASQDKIEYEIYFDRSADFFNGHFPEFKVLPGAVQLYLAKELANAHFKLELGQGQMRRIKFSNIITPARRIKLSLEKTEKAVSYKFFDDEKVYSSGIFDIKNVFKELGCT